MDAGLNQTVPSGATVQLEGSGSGDPHGDPGALAFFWSMVELPADGNASLSNPLAVQPEFFADEMGTYRIELIVHDGEVSSVPANVQVYVTDPDACLDASHALMNDTTVAVNHGGWFDFVAVSDGTAVKTCGSDFDTVLEVWNNDCTMLLAENDDCDDGPYGTGSDPHSSRFNAHTGNESCLSAETIPGETYGVHVREYQGDAPPPFWAAQLQCDPYFTDWSAHMPIHVYGQSIRPSETYDVQLVTQGGEGSEANFSTALSIATSAWGDMANAYDSLSCQTMSNGYMDCWTPPNGDADFDDITAMVDKFKNLPGAPHKSQVDITPETPNQVVDFTDIPWEVDAFRGLPYPFTVPPPCP